MRYLLYPLVLLITLLGCKKNEVSASVSDCYPGMGVSRSERVVNAPVVVRLSGGLITGAQLTAINGLSWSACHLSDEFKKKDSLKIYVSGYFLTSPNLKLMNLTPLPFEVTEARLR